MEFTVTSEQILWLCGLVSAVWGVYKIIQELKKPSEDTKKKIEKHDQLLDQDNKRLKVVEDSQKMLLQSMLVMINHEITGNGIEKMKETRDKLQEFIIEN